MKYDEIEYKILGNDAQYITIQLDPSESIIAEAGTMLTMDDGIKLTTIFGDGSYNSGLFKSITAVGKRLITGESLCLTSFTNESSTRKTVTFTGPYIGKVIPVNLNKHGSKFICQKDSFLCAVRGISIGIFFQKKIFTGFFGGEGFIMQKLEGNGMVFLHAGGGAYLRSLKPGETITVDSTSIVAFESSVNFSFKMVGGIKSALFAREGLFLSTLTGPGKIVLQSMPFEHLAQQVIVKSGLGKLLKKKK
ncbi:MAG: AIM24 family protein [Rickettsiales bacterium]|nr:AIM24 family protein [Rickettsiales bacterium]